MAQDPLSIAATVLPGSSFDPVAFASEERKRLLNEQKEKRTRYNELFDKISSVSGGNPWDEGLRSQRQNLMDEAGNSGADGIDLTDFIDPKNAKKAFEYRGKIERLNNDAKMSQAIQGLVANTRQLLAKDGQDRGGSGAYDADATVENIKTLMSKKSVTEAQQYLSELGDNLLVTKPIVVDIDKTITNNLPKYATGVKKGDESIEGGKVVEKAWQEYTPQEVRTAFKGMLNDIPNLDKSVEKEKSEYPLLLRNMSNLDFMVMTRGNQAARKSISEMSSLYKTTKVEEPEEDKVEPTTVLTEPSKITISYTGKTSSGGEMDGSYDSAGLNPIIYNKPVPVRLLPGANSIDVETGKPITVGDEPLKGSVLFTPIKSTEEYVSTVPIKRPNGTEWPAGTILPDGDYSNNKKVVKKRFVLGTYPKKSGVATIMTPYENIKTELNSKNKIDESAISTEDQQAYDWANKNPNDPRAKQILKLLNKK